MSTTCLSFIYCERYFNRERLFSLRLSENESVTNAFYFVTV